MQPGSLNPAYLHPGTRVGPWSIVGACGCGSYGAVYLAEGVTPEATGYVALKLALFPTDARFEREADLRSRLRHPCIPRLVDHGQWQSPAELLHPYVVMEWVDGVSLYEWARECRPTSRQVLRVLADVARALEAVHSVGGVHRDVKGDNMLVRREDDRGFLTDFGSCNYPGAAPLTRELFPPDTRAYRSPEAFRFERDAGDAPGGTYAAGPADDIFALGVTAWALVTQQYPPPPDEERPGPARELNLRCGAELSQLISRMLSVQPETRGSARELAEALEQAAREAGPEADAPLFAATVHRPVFVKWSPRRSPPRGPRRRWIAAAAVVMSAVWVLSTTGREDAKEADTVAIGDAALTAPETSTHEPSALKPVAHNVPTKPLPGQLRPDANGRCPYKKLVPINGGCWLRLEQDLEDCREYSYVYKGACYQPIMKPEPPGTSSPAESSDGGVEFGPPPR